MFTPQPEHQASGRPTIQVMSQGRPARPAGRGVVLPNIPTEAPGRPRRLIKDAAAYGRREGVKSVSEAVVVMRAGRTARRRWSLVMQLVLITGMIIPLRRRLPQQHHHQHERDALHSFTARVFPAPVFGSQPLKSSAQSIKRLSLRSRAVFIAF